MIRPSKHLKRKKEQPSKYLKKVLNVIPRKDFTEGEWKDESRERLGTEKTTFAINQTNTRCSVRKMTTLWNN